MVTCMVCLTMYVKGPLTHKVPCVSWLRHCQEYIGHCNFEIVFQHKSTLDQLSSVLAQKEEISQRCHELDEQVWTSITFFD